MARGKGKKNESKGKTRVNRQLGTAKTTGRAPGGGGREANPERERTSRMERARATEPLENAPTPRGAPHMQRKGKRQGR